MEKINDNVDDKDSLKITNFFWSPNENIKNMIEFFCKKNNFQNILEIGPGFVPFSLANTFIGYNENLKESIELDIDISKLPFENKSMDFVYSRHTLEDIQNPDFAMSEIIRISNSGYIETPSPLIELNKGIDSFQESVNYAGYIHHRYIVWSNIEKCEIYFLPKYSTVIDTYFKLDYNTCKSNIDIINNYPINWNNYFVWHNKEPKVIMYKNGVNFGKNNFVNEYMELLIEAINQSIKNTDYFLNNYNIIL